MGDGIYGIDQLTMKRITNWLDMYTGNFVTKLDPYRELDDSSKKFRSDWFNDDGVLIPEIHEALKTLLRKKKYHWFADCHIAGFLGGAKFAATVGEPDVYYWRR